MLVFCPYRLRVKNLIAQSEAKAALLGPSIFQAVIQMTRNIPDCARAVEDLKLKFPNELLISANRYEWEAGKKRCLLRIPILLQEFLSYVELFEASTVAQILFLRSNSYSVNAFVESISGLADLEPVLLTLHGCQSAVDNLMTERHHKALGMVKLTPCAN